MLFSESCIKNFSSIRGFLRALKMKRAKQPQIRNNCTTGFIDGISSKNNSTEKISKLSFKNLTSNHANSKSETGKKEKLKKLRATVDLDMMREELKQLEDPPLTEEEKEISSKRLPYSFFDVPCIDLAQKLLGMILVRRLENGTILKGRIVETEAYLGEMDKASQSYQGKVTPRNLPMYMSPGTIYVYLTYGMYHCFNISSGESGSFVLIRALEVLTEISYVELLRNSKWKFGENEKLMNDVVNKIKPSELCDEPWKICTGFAIDLDDLNKKKIWNSNFIWLEEDTSLNSIIIVNAPSVNNFRDKDLCPQKLLRYYILGKGSAVLLRGLEPIMGMEEMRKHRMSRLKSGKEVKKKSKTLANHEICNGPSKMCIALQIERIHSKYSICNYKSMWIEKDDIDSDIKIVKSARIGIDSAGPEWASKPLRFYVYGNTSVSKRDKKAESEFISDI